MAHDRWVVLAIWVLGNTRKEDRNAVRLIEYPLIMMLGDLNDEILFDSLYYLSIMLSK